MEKHDLHMPHGNADSHATGKTFLVLLSAFERSGNNEKGEGEGENIEESKAGLSINPGIGFEHARPFFTKIGDGGLRFTYAGEVIYNRQENTPVGAAGMALEACTSLKKTFATCLLFTAGAGIEKEGSAIKVIPEVGPGIKFEHTPSEIFASVEYLPRFTGEPAAFIFKMGKALF